MARLAARELRGEGLCLRGCELDGHRVDVWLRRGRVEAIEALLPREVAPESLDARGGALLPGLHDHHLHLHALAAALASVVCGPPGVRDAEALAAALAGAQPRGGWIRGVGYHESVAGPLDATALDRLRDDVPVRVQHRSGALWVLNSRAIEMLELGSPPWPEGVERDPRGRPTGRLFRVDGWLRTRLGGGEHPDLEAAGRALLCSGVTGVTDAGVDNDMELARALAAARRRGALRQRIHLLGGPTLAEPALQGEGLSVGAVKILLDEPRLPTPAQLASRIGAAHAARRGVAIHAVTRAQLVLALAALEEAGTLAADRLEHASVAPPELVEWTKRLGLRIVTQPIFVAERGEHYLREVDPRDRPWLYRGRGWREAGVPLAAGSDAPYASPDPWRAMAAAVSRRTAHGLPLGPEEALDPEEALALFLSPLDEPGGPARRVEPGAPADLCLLDRPWRQARSDLAATRVAATLVGGRVCWHRDAGPG